MLDTLIHIISFNFITAHKINYKDSNISQIAVLTNKPTQSSPDLPVPLPPTSLSLSPTSVRKDADSSDQAGHQHWGGGDLQAWNSLPPSVKWIFSAPNIHRRASWEFRRQKQLHRVHNFLSSSNLNSNPLLVRAQKWCKALNTTEKNSSGKSLTLPVLPR